MRETEREGYKRAKGERDKRGLERANVKSTRGID